MRPSNPDFEVADVGFNFVTRDDGTGCPRVTQVDGVARHTWRDEEKLTGLADRLVFRGGPQHVRTAPSGT